MISAEQRHARRSRLGSSDAAAILGHDNFRTAADVYWEKCGPEIPDDPKKAKQFQVGNLLETAICEYAASRLGVTLTPNVMVADDPMLCANLDAIVDGKPQGVEAKYSSEHDAWGEEGTDQVPDRVLVQCQHQIYVAKLELVWVPALILGMHAQFRLYCVLPHPDLIEEIVAAERAFYRNHIEARVPPPGASAVPPLRYLKAMGRERKRVALDGAASSLIAAHEAAKARKKAAEAECAETQAAVLAQLGDADEGGLPDGRTLTYYEQRSGPACDYAQLRALHPGIYEDFVTQGTHRVMRIKTPKEK